jgi:hypothetical protein
MIREDKQHGWCIWISKGQDARRQQRAAGRHCLDRRQRSFAVVFRGCELRRG